MLTTGGNSTQSLTILTATSSVKTPSGTGHYHSLTTNSIALTPGTWELSGIADFSNAGVTNYTDIGAGYYGANGADTGSQPATILSGVANLTINSAYGGSGFIASYFVIANNNSRLTVPIAVVTVTASATVYLVTYSAQGTSANARITTYFTARKIYG